MKAPTKVWTRAARRLGFDRNPLRRRSDLIEAWLLPAAIIVFCVLAPLLAGAAGNWVRAGNAAVRHEQQSWHVVHATLLQPVPGPMMTDGGLNSWLVWAPARWTADGRTVTGQVPAPSGSDAGRVVPVWLSHAGRVQVPPATAAQVGERASVAVLTALTALALVVAGLALLTRRMLDRRRLARWETAWLSVGPQWTRQR
jgi:hypothetical protein